MFNYISCSAVIMQFACQRFGLGEKWFPKLAAKRARIMEYCAWQQSTGLRTAGIISTLVGLYKSYNNYNIDVLEARHQCITAGHSE